jgi:hypothetical protein
VRRTSAALIALAAGGAAAAAPSTPSAPGRYAAELCVATQAQAPPTCGAADVEIAAGPLVLVRVADIVYRLALGSDRLDLQTMHGQIQIDEFSTAYAWQGTTLRFKDPDKDVRYEVRVGARKTTLR